MSRFGPLAITCITCIALSQLWGAAQVEAQADAQVADLNSQGVEAYQSLDMDAARAKLEEALGVAQQNGLGGPVVAQVYMNLGVVQIAGFNDRDQGLAAFVSALCMQPDVQLDPLLSTPDVQQAFGQAQQDAAAGACGPAQGPAPPPGQPNLMPQQPPPNYGGPQVGDLECPPGVVCGDEGGGDAGPKDFARFFFNVQLVGAFTYVTSGLEADSKPPISEVLTGFFNDVNNDGVVERESGIDSLTGLPIEDDVIAGDGLTDSDPDGDGVPNTFDYDGNGTQDNRYYFNPASAWVPDKDSFDDYEDVAGGVPRARTPLPGTCEADGTPTGPLDVESTEAGANFADYVPSKYCVRVEQPGVVSNLALRFNPGYFITDSFALSLPIRIQFNSGEGSMSNMLVGLRGEILFSEMTEPTGFPISFFFGATYGQIQAQPPPKASGIEAPFVTSGPIGAHIGVNVRYRLHRNFGIIAAPEFDVQFPGLLFNFDLSAGVEAAF